MSMLHLSEIRKPGSMTDEPVLTLNLQSTEAADAPRFVAPAEPELALGGY